ncbi:hypothetical protein GCM10010486_30370 [Nonomuraea roseoviolacea subsp. carminata]
MGSQSSPSGGMQYVQRRLHLSVRDTRRSVATRPNESRNMGVTSCQITGCSDYGPAPPPSRTAWPYRAASPHNSHATEPIPFLPPGSPLPRSGRYDRPRPPVKRPVKPPVNPLPDTGDDLP